MSTNEVTRPEGSAAQPPQAPADDWSTPLPEVLMDKAPQAQEVERLKAECKRAWRSACSEWSSVRDVSGEFSESAAAEANAAELIGESLIDALAALALHAAPQAPEGDVIDAQRLDWLLNRLTWNIKIVRADGQPTTKADRWATKVSGNTEGMTAEWSVSFNTDYGLHESEDDIYAAVDAARSTHGGQ